MAQIFKDNGFADTCIELEQTGTETGYRDEIDELVDMIAAADSKTIDSIIDVLEESRKVLNRDMENLLKLGKEAGFIMW